MGYPYLVHTLVSHNFASLSAVNTRVTLVYAPIPIECNHLIIESQVFLRSIQTRSKIIFSSWSGYNLRRCLYTLGSKEFKLLVVYSVPSDINVFDTYSVCTTAEQLTDYLSCLHLNIDFVISYIMPIHTTYSSFCKLFHGHSLSIKLSIPWLVTLKNTAGSSMDSWLANLQYLQ